jgi:hypothetical protein
MPFGIDVECECGHVRYVFLKNSSSPPDSEDAKCPKCGSEKFTRCIGASNYLVSNDPEVRSEMLKKRSYDHTVRTAKDNVERLVERSRKRGHRA